MGLAVPVRDFWAFGQQGHVGGGADFAYIVMDLIVGVPLYTWVESHGETGDVYCEILRGHIPTKMYERIIRIVENLDGRGLVPRDAMGWNIMVADGSNETYFIDFGEVWGRSLGSHEAVTFVLGRKLGCPLPF